MPSALLYFIVGFVSVCILLGCSSAGGGSPAQRSHVVNGGTTCDDAVEPAVTVSLPPNAPQGVLYVGSGDTYFMGTAGSRWGQMVQYFRSSYYMKAPIYTLDSQAPRITIARLDGPGAGRAESNPTTEGLPGPLPTSLYFPSPGCWQVTARGRTGVATIHVRVALRRS